MTSVEGKRACSTIWITGSDKRLLNFYIPQALKRAQAEAHVHIIQLLLCTEQKRGDSERLVISVKQVTELIDKLQ